jgi:hypothetical protein
MANIKEGTQGMLVTLAALDKELVVSLVSSQLSSTVAGVSTAAITPLSSHHLGKALAHRVVGVVHLKVDSWGSSHKLLSSTLTTSSCTRSSLLAVLAWVSSTDSTALALIPGAGVELTLSDSSTFRALGALCRYSRFLRAPAGQ